MEKTLAFYEGLTGQKARQRFHYPGIDVEVAHVGDFLIVAGEEEALESFRHVGATCVIDSLDEFHSHLTSENAKILRAPSKVPTGKNMTVRHPDGLIVEYVEPQPA